MTDQTIHLAAIAIPIACALATRIVAKRLLSPRRRHLAATRRNGSMLTRPPTTPPRPGPQRRAEPEYDYPVCAYRLALAIRARLTRPRPIRANHESWT